MTSFVFTDSGSNVTVEINQDSVSLSELLSTMHEFIIDCGYEIAENSTLVVQEAQDE